MKMAEFWRNVCFKVCYNHSVRYCDKAFRGQPCEGFFFTQRKVDTLCLTDLKDRVPTQAVRTLRMAASVSNMKKKKQNVMKSMTAIRLLRSVTTGRGSVSVTATSQPTLSASGVRGTDASPLQWRSTTLNPSRREEAMTL